MSVVLMYHALFADEADLGRIAPEDRPYAVERTAFARQLDAVAERLARGPAEPGGGPGEEAVPAVVLTFDDGHASNVDVALPMLLERGLEGIFFVTAGWVGAREHFVDAPMLRELVGAGMTVGAHGSSHRFLERLDAPGAREELAGAREALEEAAGVPVRSMSFPGGRHDAEARRCARAAGLGALFDSRVAPAPPAELGPALALARHEARAPDAGPATDGPEAAAAPLPRVAIRRDTDDVTLARMIGPDPAWYTAARRGERVRHLARRVLGNRIYHGLYKSLRGG